MMTAHFGRIATGSLVLVLAVAAGPLLAKRLPPTPRIPQPVPAQEEKPAGKWVVNGAPDWSITVEADGTARYNFTVDGKASVLTGKLKDGELRLDFGNGMFLIYTAAVRDDKLVLTAGNLKAGTEIAFAKADDGPPPAPAAPVAPKAPAPKAPATAAEDETDDPTGIVEKGLHDAPRGPRPAPKPPKDGAEPTETFLRNLIQHGREGNSGGITYLMEIKSVKYGPARKAAPTETQPYATGSQVYPVSMKWTSKAYGQGSTAVVEKETRFICWKTDTGEWRSGHVEEKEGEIKSIDK